MNGMLPTARVSAQANPGAAGVKAAGRPEPKPRMIEAKLQGYLT